MKFTAIAIVIFMMSFQAVTANDRIDACTITGEVLAVRLGEHTEVTFDNNGKKLANLSKFTELTIKIHKAETKKKSKLTQIRRCEPMSGKEIKAGLCEDQTIVAGDVITGDTDGWFDGPDCLVNVRFIKKAGE